MDAIVSAVGSGLTAVIGWIGNVITALVGSTGALNPLLPMFAVGISISLVLLGIKCVKSVVWGA